MTASRQRLLALGILFVAIAVAWLLVIQPVADAFVAQGETIAQSRSLLAAYQSRIARRAAVEARLADLRTHETSSTGLIGGASAELAAASIQKLVKTLIESEAGQVHSAQNLPPVTADGFQRIDIQYDASIPMTRLRSLAYRIETGTPYLFLDGIDMRSPESWESNGLAMDPPNLEVRWTVRAYRWTGAR